MEGDDFQPRKRRAATNAKDAPKKFKKGKRMVDDVTDDEEEPLSNNWRRMSRVNESQEQQPQEETMVEQRTLSDDEWHLNVKQEQIKKEGTFPEPANKMEGVEHDVGIKAEVIKSEEGEGVSIKQESLVDATGPIIKIEPVDW
jgi:hypothetical protein